MAARDAVEAIPPRARAARPGPHPWPLLQEVPMRFWFLVSLIAGFAAPGLAAAQDQAAGGWQAMRFHDFQIPSPTDPLQTLVWPDVIREANAYVTTQLKRPLNGR